ncbi:hypothetical protein FRB97_008680 [Tulasnella sp. 331]|nr:hypothetical protein FRB97_008680 [Tulasnella sp. 331]
MAYWGRDRTGSDDGSDHSSSAPNSEFEFEDDGEPADVELCAVEYDDHTDPIPVILRLIPPTVPDGPPVLEVWGARPFGYAGSSIVWTTYRAEPESDDIDDSISFWAPLGIDIHSFIYYRAFLVRQTQQTTTHAPPAPRPTEIAYVPEDRMIQPVDAALLVRITSYRPEDNTNLDGHNIGNFWLVGCGRVRDRKDWKRISQKIDIYLNVVRSPDPAMRSNALPYDHPYYRPLPPNHPEYHPSLM